MNYDSLHLWIFFSNGAAHSKGNNATIVPKKEYASITYLQPVVAHLLPVFRSSKKGGRQ